MKKYDVGLLVGRFNVFHIGHKSLADLALTMCDRLLILVGSAQESGTLRNPFSVETRIKMIKEIYPNDNVIVRGLPDLTNENDICPEWGSYLLSKVHNIIGNNPNIMIYGNDESRSGWFAPEDIKDIMEIVVPRSEIPISATELRQLMVSNNKDKWCKYHSSELHKYFYELRLELINCPVYKEKINV